jgi:hypothetical protein
LLDPINILGFQQNDLVGFDGVVVVEEPVPVVVFSI